MKPLTVVINESNIYAGAALGLTVLIGLVVISTIKNKRPGIESSSAIIA